MAVAMLMAMVMVAASRNIMLNGVGRFETGLSLNLARRSACARFCLTKSWERSLNSVSSQKNPTSKMRICI
jgi:hypothetical protein